MKHYFQTTQSSKPNTEGQKLLFIRRSSKVSRFGRNYRQASTRILGSTFSGYKGRVCFALFGHIGDFSRWPATLIYEYYQFNIEMWVEESIFDIAMNFYAHVLR